LDEISEHGNIGEASLYGVYFDDTDYDYMQHLRTVADQEDGIESILIEAPVTSKRNATVEPISKKILDFLDLPDGVLASASEVPRNFETQQAIPDSIAGFQPDMDTHLRQALEALDDDAFVDENLDDDFFSELVGDGERGSDEDIDFEFTPGGITEFEHDINGVEEESWEKRFSDFKKRHQKSLESDSDRSDGDTVRELPAITVIGGKKRRKGSSEASGYSMSSSSIYRNEALQTLDERFDQVWQPRYRMFQFLNKNLDHAERIPG
jgi:protein LTV1